MSTLDDLGSVLQTAGVGTVGSTIWLGQLPAAPPENCLAIFEYAGVPPLHGFGALRNLPIVEYPRIQVQTRSRSYVTARALATDAISALDWFINTTVNGVRYYHVAALNRPAYLLRRDENDLFVFAANFEVAKQAST